MKPIAVIVEATGKRAFASAADWPGWARGGKTESEAIDALARYADRYRRVVERAGLDLPEAAGLQFEVAERVPGDASTDYGVPGRATPLDARPTDGPTGDRLARLVSAAWETFDEIAAHAPVELRKGPRGGGRDTPKIVDHVVDAEFAYAGRIGLKLKGSSADRASIEAERTAVRELLATPSDGGPVGRWPIRYAARRIAWHLLDHAWEIEDRTPRD